MKHKLLLWVTLWLLIIQVSSCLCGKKKAKKKQKVDDVSYIHDEIDEKTVDADIPDVIKYIMDCQYCSERESLVNMTNTKFYFVLFVLQRHLDFSTPIARIILQYLCSTPIGVSTIPHGHPHAMINLLLSHDDRYLFTYDTNHEHKIYELDTGNCVRTLAGHGCEITLQLSVDDQRFLTQDALGQVRVLHHPVEELAQWESFGGLMKKCVMTRDNQFFVIHNNEGTINACVASGLHYRAFQAEALHLVTFLAVTRDLHWLIAGVERSRGNYELLVWNFQTGKLENRKVFYNDDGMYRTCFHQPQEHCVMTANDEWIIVVLTQGIRITNLPQMDQMYSITYYGPNVTSCKVAQNPNTGEYVIAVGGWNDLVRSVDLWVCRPDFSHIQKTHTITPHGKENTCCLTSDGRIVITGGRCNGKEIFLEIWDTTTGELYNANPRRLNKYLL